jgi:hypothetical protein
MALDGFPRAACWATAHLVPRIVLRSPPFVRAVALLAALGLTGGACGGGTQCVDGWPSPSTGSGACARHGGVAPPSSLVSYFHWTLAGGIVAALGYGWFRVKRQRRRDDTPAEPTSERAALRKLIQTVVKSDSDLDAFCLDHFREDVYDAFTTGMERSQKISILLRNADPERIHAHLWERWPEAMAAYEVRAGVRRQTPAAHP